MLFVNKIILINKTLVDLINYKFELWKFNLKLGLTIRESKIRLS